MSKDHKSNQSGNTNPGIKLHYAAEKGDISSAGNIIENDIKYINYIDESGFTPLFRAVMSRQNEFVLFLLDNGADPDIQTREGFTPLMAAAESGNAELLKSLLDHKANPDLRSIQGTTSLHIAASMGYVKIITLLLEAGADPSIRDNTDIKKILEKQTGQQITLTGGDENMLKGLTALDVARMCGHAEAEAKLIKAKS